MFPRRIQAIPSYPGYRGGGGGGNTGSDSEINSSSGIWGEHGVYVYNILH